MIVEKEADKIIIRLESPHEREMMNWIWGFYGPNFLRKWVLRLVDERFRAKAFIEAREAADGDSGNNPGGRRVVSQ